MTTPTVTVLIDALWDRSHGGKNVLLPGGNLYQLLELYQYDWDEADRVLWDYETIGGE